MSITALAASKLSASNILAPVAVSDNATNLATPQYLDKLQALAVGAKIASITITGATTITITAATLLADATALLKISNATWTIAITGTATAAQVIGANATLIAKLTAGFVVADTSANVVTNLNALQARIGSITSIALTNTAPALSITAAQLIADSALLVKITSLYGISLTGVATVAQAVAANTTLTAKLSAGFVISDTAANVAANLAGLQVLAISPGKLSSIALTGTTPVLSITAASFIANATALSAITTTAFSISISSGSVTAAQVIAASSTLIAHVVAGLVISDTSANLVANLDALQGRVGLVASIALTNTAPVLLITANQLIADAATLLKISSAYAITLSGTATVAQAVGATATLDGKLTAGFVVSDTSANVAANLDALQALISGSGKLASIALTDTAPVIAITAAQFIADNGVLAKISSSSFGITLSSGVLSAAQAIGISAALLPHLTGGVVVSDSSVNIVSHLDALQTQIGSVFSITLTDTTPVLSITAAQLTADAAILLKITGNYGIALTGAVTAAQAIGASSTLVARVTAGFVVSDTSAQVASNLDALQALGSSVASIALTGTTPLLSITATQFIADATTLAKITGTYAIALTGAITVAQVTAASSTLVAKVTGGFAISDTSAHVVSSLDALQALGNSVVAIAPTDTTPVLSITPTQLLADATTLAKITGTYAIAPTGAATVAQATGANATFVAKLTARFAVSDTAAHVSGGLDALQLLGSLVASIALTDTTPVLSITPTQLLADATTLAKITGTYAIAPAGAATVAQATAASSTLVGHLSTGFVISDTASQVGTNLDALQARAASVAFITLTDTTPVLSITTPQLGADATILLKITGSYGIALTGAATVAQATGANATLVAKLTAGFLVSDTSAQVATSLNALQALGSSVASIALTNTTPVLSITASQLIADTDALLKISSSYNIALTGTATAVQATAANSLLVAKLTASFTVSDTASDIASSVDALQAHTSSIVSIALTDLTPVLPITAAQFIADAPTLAKISGNYSIALTDTTPVLPLSIAQFAADKALLLKIAGNYTITLSGTASAADVAQFVAFSTHFSTSDLSLTVADTAANLTALAAVPASLATVNALGSPVLLTADASLTVAAALPLASFHAFSAGTHQLTIIDSATDLLAPSAAPALAIATATQLSQTATVSVANAVALTALPDFSTGSYPLTVADTPAALASLPPAVADLATAETVVPITTANQSGYTISTAQLTSLLALAGLSVSSFSGSVTLSDTASALAGEATVLASAPTGSLLSHIVTALSADATVTAATASVLAALPGFTLSGHILTIQDTSEALLSPGAAAGEAIATSVELSSTAVVTAASATALVALQDFSTGGHAFIVLDTPAALAALPSSVNALATFERIASSTIADAAAYSLTVSQFITLSQLPLIVFSGFTGGITVLDTAANLASLAAEISSAAIGSTLQVARGAIETSLSADGTVTAAQLTGLIGLPVFSVNRYGLTLLDTPSAVLAAFPNGVPDATAVTLAANTSPWVVTAGAAATLAAMPAFSVGSAGITVTDTAANILLAANAAGVADAGSVNLSTAATVTAAAAQTLAGMADFHLNGQNLTISDTAVNLAGLAPQTAAMAFAIQLEGASVVTVAQFVALRALPNFSDNSFALIISDNATDLLTLGNTSVALASEILLSSNATGLSAQQAEQIATLANFSTVSGHISVSDTAADLLLISGTGQVPDDWAGELAASSVTLTANGTVSAYQADQLALLGSRFSLGGFTLTISDTAAHLIASANATGRAIASGLTLSGNETALSAAYANRLAGLTGFSKGAYSITISDTAANLTSGSYTAGIALANAVQLSTAAVLTVAGAEALVAMSGFQGNLVASVTISDTLANLLTLAVASAAALQSMPIMLSADATATVAQLAALAALPQYALTGHSFSLNGHALTVVDTAANIAAYTPDSIVTPAAYVLSGDGTVSAAQATTLAGIAHFSLGGFTLAIADSLTNLLLNANHGGILLATTVRLAGATTTTAAQATQLVALHGWSNTQPAITVQDTYDQLLTTAYATGLAAATTVALSASAAGLTAAQATTLAGIAHFTPGIYTVAIADSLANLLLAGNQAGILLASTVQLSGVTTASASQATQLVALHGWTAGPAITVQDTATSLLNTAYATGLAAATTVALGASATGLTAAQATTLAGIAHFTPGAYTVAIADSLANLLNTSNSAGILLATTVQLSGITTASASQATQLVALHGWSSTQPAITVQDTYANLLNTAYATGLAAATAVALSASATGLTAAQATTLASIAHFTPGAYTVAIADSLANLLLNANQAGILVASTVQLSGVTTASASQATQLVALHGWTAGPAITVQDTYANLLNTSYAAGLAAATTISLSANATALTAAQAAALSALPNLSLGSFVVTVSDTAANVDAAMTGLLALGSKLTAVTLTDTGSVSPAAAAGLSAIVGKLTGPAIAVSGTAGAVSDNMTALLALGSHISGVAVSDTAAHVAAYASGTNALTALGSLLHITLTDTTGVSAITAAGLLPVDTQLSAAVNVLDTATAIAAQAATLALLVTKLGTVTVSGSTVVTAAVAAAMLPIYGELRATGTTLQVSDSAAAIASVGSTLVALRTDGLVTTVTAAAQSVVSIVAYATTLHSLGATATITDSAAAVNTSLDALEAFTGGYLLTSITLSDSSTPTLTLTVTQLTSDSVVLGLITSPYHVAVNDLNTAIATDLALGTNSILNTYAVSGRITSITPTGGSVALTDAKAEQVLTALGKFSAGSLIVTGVTVADVNTIAALTGLTSMTVSDSALAITTDLLLGAASHLQLHAVPITSITPGGTVTLTDTQAELVLSALGKFSAGSLIVTGVTVADVNTIAALTGLTSMTVSDSATAITTDLLLGAASHLQLHAVPITSITPGGTVTLTDTQAELVLSALGKFSTGSLIVTGVTVADVNTIAALTGLTSMTVSDSAANVQANLILGTGSVLWVHASAITGITFSSGVSVSLTDTQAELVLAALAKLPLSSLMVSNVSITDIPAIFGLSALSSMTVQDSAANVQTDLINGTSSKLQLRAGVITGVTFSSGTSVALTDIQAELVLAALAKLPASSVSVSAVSMADVATIGGLAAVTSMTVTGLNTAIATDLALGTGSLLNNNAGKITSITPTGGGTVTLSDGQPQMVLAALAKLPAGSVTVTGVSIADVGTLGLLTAVAAMTVTGANTAIASDLALGANSLLNNNAAKITSITPTSGTVTLTDAQAELVLAALAKLTTGSVIVNAVSIADVATLGLLAAATSMTVTGLNTAIAADLALGTGSVLNTYASKISSIIPTGGTVTLTDGQPQLVLAALAKLPASSVTVTGVSIADVPTIGALAALTSMSVSDTGAAVTTDLALGNASVLKTNVAKISGISLSSGAVALTDSQAELVLTALAKLPTSSLTVSAVSVADLGIIGALSALTSMSVSDTGAAVTTDLALGNASVLKTNVLKISGISLSSGTVALTDTQAELVLAALAKLTAGSVTVSGVSAANIATIGGLSALASLTVSDTAANVDSAMTGLLALGSKLTAVTLTDTGSVSAAAAAGLSAIVGKLTGPAIAVSGTAGAVSDNMTALLALGSHISGVAVSDTAAHVAAYASGTNALTALGSLLHITLTDTTGVSAITAAGLLPVDTQLSAAVNVLDTATAIAAQAATLALLVTKLGTVTVSGSTVVTAAVAAAMLPIYGELRATGTTLQVSDSAAAIASVGSTLVALRTDGLVTTVTAAAQSVVSIVAYATTLHSLGATATITDSAAAVNTSLDALEAFTGGYLLTSITLSDSTTPTLTLTVTQLTSDSVVLGLISSPYHVAVSDTASDVQTDLASGTSSAIIGHWSSISGIILSPAGTITLTEAQAVFAGVATALNHTTNLTSFLVTGTTVAQIGAVLALAVTNTRIGISDTSLLITADLQGGLSSLLQINASQISSITPASSVTLTDTQAELVLAALGKFTSNTLIVTGVSVTDVNAIAALTGLTSMTVSDSAAAITADLLVGASSHLQLHATAISTITPASAVTLTDTQADAVLNALGKFAASSVTVTGVPVADVATIAALTAVTSMTVSDVNTTIATNLAQGASSVLNMNYAKITSITPTGGTVTLADGIPQLVSSAIAKLPTGSVTVTGVSVAHIGTITGLAAVATTTVSDTAADVQADLALGSGSAILSHLAKISTIALPANSTITLTAAQLSYAGVDDGGSSALAKITTGLGHLALAGVLIAAAGTLPSLTVSPTQIAIGDSIAHIIADLALGSSSIILTTPGIISVALTDGSADVADATTIFTGLPNSITFDESSLTITDTAANLVAAQGANPTMLTAAQHVTLSANATGLTAAQATTLSGILGANLNGHTLQITDSAANLLASNNAAGIALATDVELGAAVTDNAANVTALSNVANFHANGQLITIQDTKTNLLNVNNAGGIAIATTVELNANSTVTAADLASLAALHNYTAAYSLTVQDTASAIVALTLTQLNFSAAVVVNDGATNVTSKLDLLQSVVTANSHPLTINLTGAVANTPVITVTAATYVADGATIDTISTHGTVKVIDAAANIAAIASTLQNDVVVGEVDVTDTAANIIANLSTLSSIGAKFMHATPSDATITVAQATTIYTAIGAKFVESGLTITDTAANLLAARIAHPAILTAAQHIALSANDTGETAANATILAGLSNFQLGGFTVGIADTMANLLNGANANGITLATTVQLSGPTTATASQAAQLVALHNWTTGPAITVQDTYTNLLAGNAAGLAAATTVLLSADATGLTTAQLTALALLHGFGNGGNHLTVTGNVTNIVALSTAALNATTGITVSDTSAHVLASLGSLQTIAGGHTTTIALSDGATGGLTITVPVATYVSDLAAIDAITYTGSVLVTGGAAALAAEASVLAGDTRVGKVAVTDSVANILANLTSLNAIGSKFNQTSISDTTVNAAQVSSLLTLTGLVVPSGFAVVDTGSLIAAAIQGSSAVLTFMNSTGVAVDLSANSVIAASDAVSLELLTSLHKSGFHLYVWDTASHLTDSADNYLAAVGNTAFIDGVYLKTTSGNSATITAATAAILLGISNFSVNDPPTSVGGDGVVNTLIVSDTAAHLESSFTALHTNRTQLSGIVVSGAATITDAVFADLLTLTATTSASLTVRDTAANIYNNAPTQLTGTLQAAAWQLSGSAPVTEGQAVILAGLTGFSAGAYTLTLSATSAVASVTAANLLGALGSSFSLGAFQLSITGNVATLLTLNSGAKAIVTPTITDTFANLAALSASSGILGGTIYISDIEPVTFGQVESFLGLLKPDNTSGAAVANVHFQAGAETVTDTLANIQALTSYGLWTDHVSIQSNFTLKVADTVAVLTTAGNTSALAGMASTTLNGSQSTTAASAESLFTLTSTIHFSLGSNQITILDTAAHILNQANSDGEALATAWQLNANATVVAADAETLLTQTKFQTNNFVLTIADTSANLLDGVLSGDITANTNYINSHASVVVELAGPETLDAQTAHALVGLPGFFNNGDLAIADGSSYLLNSANFTAESDATSVTLAGNETVSAATAASLAALSHFGIGGNILSLASADFANAAQLNAIAGYGSNFHLTTTNTLTLTQDDFSATPTEYATIQSEISSGLVLNPNSHLLSAMPSGAAVTSASNVVSFTATGVSTATLNVYAATGGAALSSTALSNAAISVTQADDSNTVHGAVVITETVGGVESAPIIALDATVVTSTAGAAAFATAGQVQVGSTAHYMNLYTAGAQPTQAAPELVYSSTAHTLSLDVNSTMTVLVTLGTATHPSSLDPSEIFIKTFA